MRPKTTAAHSAVKSNAAPAPTPAGPATVESLGQQLREVLPARRLHSVSLCDHEANVLWLSEGALGPDEHMLVIEALDVLNADSSLPCHETGLEDGRLGVFLPVRAPTGSLVGVAMILADSKSVGDDTLERMTASPVRTIMQRLAVLLKPSGVLDTGPEVLAVDPLSETDEGPSPIELSLVEMDPSAVAIAAPAPAPPPAAPPAAPVVRAVAPTPAPPVVRAVAPAPTPPADEDDESETIITAAEIANILELELVEEAPAAAAESPAAPAREPAKPAAPAAPESPDDKAADSGMVKLEFLAEPPVVRPAPNPTAVARKIHAASKMAATQTSRTLRPVVAAPAPAARPAPAATPAARAPSAQPTAKGPVAAPAPVAASAAKAAPPGGARTGSSAAGPVRNPFEPIPAHSRLSLSAADDDVVVLFEAEPPKIPTPAARAAGAAPAAGKAAPPAAARLAQPPRAAPGVRIAPPTRSAPAVRNAPPQRPAPAAAPRTPPSAPSPAPVPAAAPAPVVAAVAAPAPSPAPPPAAPAAAPVAAAALAVVAPQIELVPFAKLRPGGQTRRFQVQARGGAQRDSAAVDEQTLQQLIEWLGANRAMWTSIPTTFTVNLSIATLEDERFLQKVSAALNTHGIAGETLGFEIAESLCAQNRVKVERFISQCEKAGIWVAIDDFSFDSAVLPLLRSKALRLLKIDARLTSAALRDKLSQAVVVATVQAAKVLGVHCAAKKADSQASLQYLGAIGLDFAQGAALSRPVPLDQLGSVSNETRKVPALNLDNLE